MSTDVAVMAGACWPAAKEASNATLSREQRLHAQLPAAMEQLMQSVVLRSVRHAIMPFVEGWARSAPGMALLQGVIWVPARPACVLDDAQTPLPAGCTEHPVPGSKLVVKVDWRALLTSDVAMQELRIAQLLLALTPSLQLNSGAVPSQSLRLTPDGSDKYLTPEQLPVRPRRSDKHKNKIKDAPLPTTGLALTYEPEDNRKQLTRCLAYDSNAHSDTPLHTRYAPMWDKRLCGYVLRGPFSTGRRFREAFPATGIKVTADGALGVMLGNAGFLEQACNGCWDAALNVCRVVFKVQPPAPAASLPIQDQVTRLLPAYVGKLLQAWERVLCSCCQAYVRDAGNAADQAWARPLVEAGLTCSEAAAAWELLRGDSLDAYLDQACWLMRLATTTIDVASSPAASVPSSLVKAICSTPLRPHGAKANDDAPTLCNAAPTLCTGDGGSRKRAGGPVGDSDCSKRARQETPDATTNGLSVATLPVAATPPVLATPPVTLLLVWAWPSSLLVPPSTC